MNGNAAHVAGKFDAVKVFCATKARDRSELGDRITRWIGDKKPDIVETVVQQSSDQEFHCLSIVVFYREA